MSVHGYIHIYIYTYVWMYAIIYVLVFACMLWARALRRALDTKHGALDTEHPTDTHVECPPGLHSIKVQSLESCLKQEFGVKVRIVVIRIAKNAHCRYESFDRFLHD